LIGVAVNVTLAPTHIEVWLAAIDTNGVTLLTAIVMEILVAVGDVVQEALLVIVTLTWSLFARVVVINVAVVSPGTVIPFTCHKYVGDVPPFAGVALNVTDVPAHIAPEGDAAMVTPGVTLELTVIVIGVLVAVGVVVQVALLVMITLTWSLFARVVVVKVDDVCPATGVPFICHSYVGAAPPLVGVAVKVTFVPTQIEVWLAETDTDGVTLVTVIVIGVLVAVVVVVQAALLVIVTVTWSLFARVVVVNVDAVCPATGIPFIFHWYEGVVPPFTGVAVNITEVPVHIAPEGDAAMVTPGVTLALTVIFIGVLLAVGEVVQFAFEVITTVTISLFASVAEVKVGLFVPAFEPFILHWYEGVVPPFTGVALNVTDVPAHIAPEGDAAIVTAGVTLALTVIVMGVLVAVGVVVQVALLVIVTVT
jgi:hypothetical protein